MKKSQPRPPPKLAVKVLEEKFDSWVPRSLEYIRQRLSLNRSREDPSDILQTAICKILEGRRGRTWTDPRSREVTEKELRELLYGTLKSDTNHVVDKERRWRGRVISLGEMQLPFKEENP